MMTTDHRTVDPSLLSKNHRLANQQQSAHGNFEAMPQERTKEKLATHAKPRIEPLRTSYSHPFGSSQALGLKNKGHLGVGADADVAIYNVNPERPT